MTPHEILLKLAKLMPNTKVFPPNPVPFFDNNCDRIGVIHFDGFPVFVTENVVKTHYIVVDANYKHADKAIEILHDLGAIKREFV